MTLIRIGKVDDSETMLDIAFRRARERRDATAEGFRGKTTSRLEKSKKAEKGRVLGAGKSLAKQLETVHDSFPSFNHLAPFYQELITTVVDMDDLRQALGAVRRAAEIVDDITRNYTHKIDASSDLPAISALRREHYGRCASAVKKVDKKLGFLDIVRKKLKDLPTVKTSVPTVVITGMPNVGKSTLLSSLTGAKPEIQPYPFTTKHLMLGYAEIDGNKVQFIDTPGLLERPAKDRNAIERRATLAIKHLANVVLFLIDPTLSSGYSLEEQLILLDDIRKEFDVPLIVAINKADIPAPRVNVPDAITIAAKTGFGIDKVRKALQAALPKETPTDEP